MEKQLLLKRTIKIIAVLILVLLIFKAGVYDGYRKFEFSSRLGNSYYTTFGGPMMMGFFHDDIPGGHGVSGKVIKASPTAIVVEGTDNIEKIVTISADTLVRRARETASTTAVQVNDAVIVIGSPGQNGEIAAKLIRILPPIPEFGQTSTKK